jgi:hypothetical protein
LRVDTGNCGKLAQNGSGFCKKIFRAENHCLSRKQAEEVDMKLAEKEAGDFAIKSLLACMFEQVLVRGGAVQADGFIPTAGHHRLPVRREGD